MLLVQVVVDIEGVDEAVVRCVFGLVEDSKRWVIKVSTIWL
jgi:hypothetical protein